MDDMAEIIRGGRSCRLINTKFAIQCWCRQIIASSSKTFGWHRHEADGRAGGGKACDQQGSTICFHQLDPIVMGDERNWLGSVSHLSRSLCSDGARVARRHVPDETRLVRTARQNLRYSDQGSQIARATACGTAAGGAGMAYDLSFPTTQIQFVF
jgi:hypothetical protein